MLDNSINCHFNNKKGKGRIKKEEQQLIFIIFRGLNNLLVFFFTLRPKNQKIGLFGMLKFGKSTQLGSCVHCPKDITLSLQFLLKQR